MKIVKNKIIWIIIILILMILGFMTYINNQSKNKNLKEYVVIDLNTKTINKINIEKYGIISEEGLVAIKKDGLWRIYR